MSVICGQELFCHLMTYHLTVPTDDNWISFRNAITVWVDCWFQTQPEFAFVGDNELSFSVEGKRIATLRWQPENEYPLQLERWVQDDQEYSANSY